MNRSPTSSAGPAAMSCGTSVRQVDRELHGRDEQLLLRPEVVVDEGRIDLGPRRDVADRRRLEAALAKARPGGRDDPAAGVARTPAAGRIGSNDLPADRQRGDRREEQREPGQHEQVPPERRHPEVGAAR